MNDFKTPEADAKVDMELAGAGVSGAGVVADQADAATGTLQTRFTESGHQQMSDVNVQELISAATGLLANSAATLKAGLDQVHLSRQINQAGLDHIVSSNAAHLNNLVNSASHRHSELATDRQWNINETDFYAFVAASVAAAVAKNAEG